MYFYQIFPMIFLQISWISIILATKKRDMAKYIIPFTDVGGMTRVERLQYDEALRKYRDTISVFEGVRLEGRAEGRVEGREEGIKAIARNLKSMGMSISDISKPQACRKMKSWHFECIVCNLSTIYVIVPNSVLLRAQGKVLK